MLNSIGDSLSDFERLEDNKDGEDEDDEEEDTNLGKLSKDDKPGWVLGTISNKVQHSGKSFRLTQMRFDEVTHRVWGDAANYFR